MKQLYSGPVFRCLIRGLFTLTVVLVEELIYDWRTFDDDWSLVLAS